MAEMASAEERSAHLHVLIKKLKASGFDEEEISAGITIAKVAALREFVQENEDIVFQGTDDEVMAAAVKKFGTGNGYELTTAASSLVTEVCSEWSIGGKYQMDCALGAVVGDKKGNSSYKTDWIDSIDMEALRGVVKARAKHDTDWKVFDNAKIFSKDKIYVASLIQQFTDEELVYAEEGTFTPGGEFEDPEYEVHLLGGFGVEVPQPKQHGDLSYGEDSEIWDLPQYSGSGDYIAVEKPGQVRYCRKELGVTTLATDNERTARLCFKDIRKYGDWYYCTEVEFKEDETKEEVPVIETVPKALRTVYKALNSDPGRSYYLHGKNRSKFFRFLISNDYLHSAREDNRRFQDAAKPRKNERYPPRSQGPRGRDVPPAEKYKSGHRQKAEQRSYDHKRRAQQDDKRGHNSDAQANHCALPDELQSQLRKVISLKMQPTVLADECQFDEGLLRTLDDRSFVGAGKHTITKEILSKVPLEWIPVEDFFTSAKRVTSGREKCKDQDDLTVLAITRVSSNMDWKETDDGPMVRRK